MIRTSDKKRLRTFGKHFLIITSLILLGTILDMIFPAVGLPALPGSNVTQFLGLIILFYAMDVLVFDDKYRLCIANEAASEFLVLPKEKDRLKDYRIESLFTLNNNSIFDFDNPHYSYDAVCQVNNAPCSLTISKIKDSYGDIIGYIDG